MDVPDEQRIRWINGQPGGAGRVLADLELARLLGLFICIVFAVVVVAKLVTILGLEGVAFAWRENLALASIKDRDPKQSTYRSSDRTSSLAWAPSDS